MKAVLLLALAFAGAQSVAWADCCCGAFCAHKNECTGCPPGGACPGGKRKASCCGEEERTVCSHHEPSGEIDGHPDAVVDAPVEVDLLLPPLPWPAAATARDVEPCGAGPPLHLLFSVLRI